MLLAQTEFSPHAFERPRQAKAKGVGGNSDPGGDLGPGVARGPLFGQGSLLVRQALLDSIQKVTTFRRSRGIAAGIDQVGFACGGGADPALIAAGGPFPERVICDSIARHRRQQGDELLGPILLELSVRRAHEEVAEDRLADIHRVEPAAQLGIGKTCADCNANGWLVAMHELGAGLLIAFSNAADEFNEIVVVCHD